MTAPLVSVLSRDERHSPCQPRLADSEDSVSTQNTECSRCKEPEHGVAAQSLRSVSLSTDKYEAGAKSVVAQRSTSTGEYAACAKTVAVPRSASTEEYAAVAKTVAAI
eukprot:3404853-Rhodomonas_salina.2